MMKLRLTKKGETPADSSRQGGYELGKQMRHHLANQAVGMGNWLNLHQMDKGLVVRNVALFMLIAGGLSYFIYILLQVIL